MNIGRLYLSSDWSSDCHWDFTDAESGDEYRDFFSIATVKRKPYPEVFILMVCIGPVCFVIGLLPKSGEGTLDRPQDDS